MRVEKFGVNLPFTFESLLATPSAEGQYVEIPLTDEDIAAHARAVLALRELEENPWAIYAWDEGWTVRELKPRRRFVPEGAS